MGPTAWPTDHVARPYPSAPGTKEFTRIAKPYDVDVIPHRVIIGRDGRIAHVHVGYDESMVGQILDEVDELIDQPAQPPAAPAPVTPAG